MMRLRSWSVLAIGMVWALAPAALAETITATDPVAEFSVGSGVITSYETGGGSGDATVLPGSSFGPNTRLHIELQLDGAETPFTFGTLFSGTADAIPDLYILENGNPTPLLTANLISTAVTNQVPGAAGATLTSVTLGGLDPGQSSLVLTGGSLVNSFGGIGAPAQISILLNAPSEAFAFGSFFDQSFTAQMNVQLELVPEPGSFVLMAGPLVGLGIWRRRARLSRC
jgi:hypothetical protein